MNTEKKYIDLEANETYKFYIEISDLQKASIYLSFNQKETYPIYKAYIEEYINIKEPSIKKSEIYFSKNKNIDGISSLFQSDYYSDENYKNFISLEFTSNVTISDNNFFIQINISEGYYELEYYYGDSLHLYAFNKDIPIYILTKAKYGSLLEFYLSIYNYYEDHEIIPFENLTIIEYSDIGHKYILEKGKYKTRMWSEDDIGQYSFQLS